MKIVRTDNCLRCEDWGEKRFMVERRGSQRDIYGGGGRAVSIVGWCADQNWEIIICLWPIPTSCKTSVVVFTPLRQGARQSDMVRLGKGKISRVCFWSRSKEGKWRSVTGDVLEICWSRDLPWGCWWLQNGFQHIRTLHNMYLLLEREPCFTYRYTNTWITEFR